jgi:diamine N-acetyltransferase
MIGESGSGAMARGDLVRLRPLREADFDGWYRLMAENVEVSLMGAGRWLPYTIETARKRWDDLLLASPDERLTFAIDVDDSFIGTIALKHINRHSQHAWLSIVLDGSRLGQGYGRDAVRVLLRWAFTLENFRRVSLETWATNERAIRAYRAAGFVEEGRMREMVWVDGQYVDVVQMGVLRDEWLPAHGEPR